MTVQFADCCMSQRKFHEWLGRCKGLTSVEITEHMDQRNRDNRRINSDKAACRMSISHETWSKVSLGPIGKYFILMQSGKLLTFGSDALKSGSVSSKGAICPVIA